MIIHHSDERNSWIGRDAGPPSRERYQPKQGTGGEGAVLGRLAMGRGDKPSERA